MYEERFYHKYMNTEGFIKFNVSNKESELEILSKIDLEKQANKYLYKYRNDIEEYIKKDTNFLKSLEPVNIQNNAPKIVKDMIQASNKLNVGPMATVAGAISEYVGKELLKYTDEITIENGGDIFIKCNKQKKVLIYAGKSPFSNKIALLIDPTKTPLGICTSSGTVGHSLSFGKSDAVVVLSPNTLLADAAATAIGNMINKPKDISKGIEFAKSIEEILGILIIIDDKMGAFGDIKLVKP